jgi:Mn-dependent DtxR family transcriptional regulator
MVEGLEEVGRYILRVLYDNYDSGKYYQSSVISDALEIDEALVQPSLDKMTDKELLLKSEEGYRLSEKGYSVTYQRATSYCPHL